MSAILNLRLGKEKEKKIVTIAIVALSALCYFIIFIRPAIEGLAELLPKVAMLKAQLEDAKFLIARKNAIEDERSKSQSMMDGYRQIFPRHQDIPRLLESLSSIAGESDVKIVGIKPLGKEDGFLGESNDVCHEIPIKIVAKSGYHQLGQFLERLEGLDRFIMVEDINITANTDNIKRHNVELVASTYILVE